MLSILPVSYSTSLRISSRGRVTWCGGQVVIDATKKEIRGDHRAEVRLDFYAMSGVKSGTYVAKIERTGTAPRADCVSGAAGGDVPQYAVTEMTAAG